MASSSNADNSKEVQLYPYPTHVNTANFVSIKLSGKTNYRSWQEQMRCLLDSHDMLGFIDGTLKHNQGNREWERSDTLVKGWIFGCLTEDVMDIVVGQRTSHHVWKQLKKKYDNIADSNMETLAAPTSNTVSNQDSGKYRPLYEAIVTGQWEKAQEYFIKDKDALAGKINDDDDSPLHVAIDVYVRHNIYFVENLLKEINSESLPTLVCKRQQNPLHRAALAGNTQAAKMLVMKNPNLLFFNDKKGLLPIHSAIFGSRVVTFKYLLEVTKEHIGLSQLQGHDNPFKGPKTAELLNSIIGNGLFEVAYELIKEYPDMARTKDNTYIPLKSISGRMDAYLSGTNYNFYQKLVYHHVPIHDHNLDNGHETDQDMENQFLDTNTPITEGRRSCFYSVIRWIYVKLWKVLQHVAHVKRLHEDKVKHNKALLLLECICKELQEIEKESELREHYHEAVLFALKNDNTEPLEEIIKSFPQAFATKQNDLPLLQLSVVNRCENVYKFLEHKSVMQRFLIDKDGNNILHLAGQLAPLHKLNKISGAALQMQKELQWFEKVKKFTIVESRKGLNKKQETPFMVFRREHKELRKEGEEWIKKTADSYTITATLIISIAFAAAISVPSGNDDNTEKAIHATNLGFIIFMVSDAISLFTSTTSLLFCLPILTMRYRDEDFLYRLPMRLILGHGSLIISVISMTIAFSAALFIMFAHGKAWILYLIVVLTILPIGSFATFQQPMLQLISSTCGQGVFGKQSDVKTKRSLSSLVGE